MAISPNKPKRNRRYAKRKAMKSRTKRKYSGFTGSKGVLKEYSYVFKPGIQYVGNTPSTPGAYIPRGANLPTIQYSTTVTSATLIPNLWDFGFSCVFVPKLDIANFQAFETIYDNYALDYITCKITYLANMATTGVNILPVLYYAVDQDDSNIPATQFAVRSRQGVKTHDFGVNQTCYIRIKPKTATWSYSATGATATPAYGVLSQGGRYWQDCQSGANDNTSYFGLKGWYSNVNLNSQDNGVNTMFKYEWTYRMRFKGAFSLA